MTEGAAAVPSDLPVPSLRRRLAAFVYEGVLLFGVVMISGLLYAGVTQQRHALVGRHGLQAFLLVVFGLYFVWFWSHGGQTVAMKAWHIRLVDRDGRPVRVARAVARYLLAWLWFLPALVALALRDIHDGRTIVGILIAGVAGYALTARLHKSHQFPHDILAGTRLVTWRPAG